MTTIRSVIYVSGIDATLQENMQVEQELRRIRQDQRSPGVHVEHNDNGLEKNKLNLSNSIVAVAKFSAAVASLEFMRSKLCDSSFSLQKFTIVIFVAVTIGVTPLIGLPRKDYINEGCVGVALASALTCIKYHDEDPLEKIGLCAAAVLLTVCPIHPMTRYYFERGVDFLTIGVGCYRVFLDCDHESGWAKVYNLAFPIACLASNFYSAYSSLDSGSVSERLKDRIRTILSSEPHAVTLVLYGEGAFAGIIALRKATPEEKRRIRVVNLAGAIDINIDGLESVTSYRHCADQIYRYCPFSRYPLFFMASKGFSVSRADTLHELSGGKYPRWSFPTVMEYLADGRVRNSLRD